MAHVIVNGIHKGDGTKKLLDQTAEFQSPLKSVTCLANSQQEEPTPGKDWDVADRCVLICVDYDELLSENAETGTGRTPTSDTHPPEPESSLVTSDLTPWMPCVCDHHQHPITIILPLSFWESLIMDLAMALHCVYSTNTFAEAVLKAANLCGDSDSVASVTGQVPSPPSSHHHCTTFCFTIVIIARTTITTTTLSPSHIFGV